MGGPKPSIKTGMPGPGALAGPARFLWWLVGRQPARVAAGAALSSLWLVGLAVVPYLLSRAVDDGLRPGDFGALLAWAGVLLGALLLVEAVATLRHRTMTRLRMATSLMVARLCVDQSTRLGGALAGRVAAGEVATVGMGDVQPITRSMTAAGPGFGSVVGYLAVVVLMLDISPVLAVVVLTGVPVLALVVGPLLSRLHRVSSGYREREGQLTGRLVDLLSGLRVLTGLGGKQAYLDTYRRESRALRDGGYRVGATASWIEAVGVGLPALFLAVVTWLAARMAAAGEITAGELVAVYGYAAMLVVPVFFFIECAGDITRALVAARRVTAFLGLAPDRPAPTATAPGGPAPLVDPVSGLVVEPGAFTVVACAAPTDALAVVDRLGRFAAPAALWGGVEVDRVPDEDFRDRVLVADNDAALFTGTVREVVAGRGAPGDERVRAAVRAAAASDVVDGLPAGLDTVLTAGGTTLSGGQRQRLRLARAVCAEPEVLIAVDPTSAVDTHTEALVVAGLREARAGLATVLVSTSPVVLDQADVVAHVVDGRVAAVGAHRDLLADPGYRALVTRGDG
ncbi:ABC transporter transmembrane domain-containing protein [Actinokineospora sp. G85]|uniref:ABC transporter transmembrane domain-containing protein n=1 Tax=Actinokineospora sp. G85 TaxID=3406626 RepID=UPI003C72E005